jgi:hypothetical protein
MREQDQVAYAAFLATSSLIESSSEADGNYFLNWIRAKILRLDGLLTGLSSVFRSATGFSLNKWERLCQRCVPIIITYARDTSEHRIRRGAPYKLDPAERMLSFVLFVKHNKSIRYESSSCNWSRSSASDDVPFVASVIKCALDDEISWQSLARRAQLGQVLPEFPGRIGHIDGTLCTIDRPSIPEHGQHYNSRKHMYCFNNVVVIDLGGLLIYVEAGSARSFHNVRCLRNTEFYTN